MGQRLLAEVHYKIKEGMRDAFLSEIKAAGIVEASRKEAGNGRYEYFYPVNDPNQLVLLEVWNTAEDLKNHAGTEHYKALSALKETYVTAADAKTIFFEQEHQEHYIASCVFTSKYPGLSQTIQNYVASRFGIPIVRCCVPNYSFEFFKDRMPETYRPEWSRMPDCGDFAPGDTVYSLCHNCSAIIEEYKTGVEIKSLWELILSDNDFPYPDYSGADITVQDCWRTRERTAEQDAVRELLKKMNFTVRELEMNREKTQFCGVSLYRPSPKRNLELAPKHFVDNAAGKFIPHSKEEQIQIMKEYCKRFQTTNVVDYCHYCQEGLELGGVNAFHIASLLFEPKECWGKLK